MKTMLTVASAALLATVAPAQKAAPIVGSYAIEGSCPGQGDVYRGTLTITKPDALFTLRWQLASGQTSSARAIEQDGWLAISYELDGSGGVMIARPTDTGWQGRWAYYRSDVVCVERWTRR